jgi:hypothetical protein
MGGAIAKKNTLLGSKLKFSGVIGPEVRIAGTTKGLEPSIIWLCVKQLLKGRGKLDDMKRKPVY